jgi:hypothetical protein
MLSWSLAEDTTPDLDTDADTEEADEDTRQSAYVFEGYEIDSSVRIMLTPQGVGPDRRSAG